MEERETDMGGEGKAQRVKVGVSPSNKVGTQTYKTGLTTPASTQTLPPQGDRVEDKMGGRVTMTGSTVVRVMTTETWVMELEGGEEITEEE